jgi:hypothetical protein
VQLTHQVGQRVGNSSDELAGAIGQAPDSRHAAQRACYTPDDGSPAIGSAALRALATTAGQEVSYTCVPPGSGQRMALDRDEDRLLNGFETNTGVFVSASDTGSNPALKDSDGDGYDDGDEVMNLGSDPNDPLDPGSNKVPALDLPALAAVALILAAVGGRAAGRRRRPIA